MREKTDDLYAATIVRRPLYDQIVQHIEQQVMGNLLRPGDRLPPERDMSEQFRVSRTVIREAIKALHEKGLVGIRPGSGTYIVPVEGQAVLNSMTLYVKTQRVALHNLIEARYLLEPEIAALAAQRAQPEDLEKMQQLITEMDQHLNSAEEFVSADVGFHLALAEATHNPVLPIFIQSISGGLREMQLEIFRVQSAPNSGQMAHRRLYRFIDRREASAARREMRRHIEEVHYFGDTVTGALEQNGR
jgi:GntR family transcriptional repressor for pyruvate dehydrogenase complex